MKEVPTAYEFSQSECLVDEYGKPLRGVETALIEFAKLHVKAALEAAADEATVDFIIDVESDIIQEFSINKESILHSYPEDLIK